MNKVYHENDLYLESLYDTLEFIDIAKKAIDLAIVMDKDALVKARALEIVTHERIVARLRVLNDYRRDNEEKSKNCFKADK